MFNIRLLVVFFLVFSGLPAALAVSVDDALGLLKDQKYSEALQALKPLADSGNADAQYQAGNLLFSGVVPGSDPIAARKNGIELIQKAADQNHPVALQALAQMHLNGTGVSKDEKKGMSLLRQSAELGEPMAQYTLGQFYRDGLHVTKNRDEAVRWLKMSADQDFPPSLFDLAVLYATAPNKNLPAAYGAYLKAAENSYVSAMRETGIANHRGVGTARNDIVAALWFGRAAAQHDSESQYQLAMLYRRGEGVKKDPVAADRLLQDAAKMGHAGAKVEIARLAKVASVPAKKTVPETPVVKTPAAAR